MNQRLIGPLVLGAVLFAPFAIERVAADENAVVATVDVPRMT